MTLPVQKPRLLTAPAEYSQEYMQNLLKQFDLYFSTLNTAGPLRGTKLNLSDLPTSTTGLSAGDLWNDGGTVKIV